MKKRLLAGLLVSLLAVSCSARARNSKSHAPGRITSKPAMPAMMYRQVLNAVDAGDGDYQVRVLRQKLAANPDDLQVRLELAELYTRQGFPEVAVEHYRLAAERFPQDAGVHVKLAVALRSLGLTQEAVAHLERNAGRSETTAETFAWLGILQDDLGRHAEAEQMHRRALAMSPQAAYLHNNLGHNLMLQRRLPEAAEELRRALRADPSSAIAKNNLGIALSAQPEEAVLQWKSVNDAATAHSNMAAIFIEQGNYAEARREISRALGYQRDHRAALANLKLVSEKDGGPAEVTFEPQRSGWRRFVSILRQVFWEPAPEKQGAAVTASR